MQTLERSTMKVQNKDKWFEIYKTSLDYARNTRSELSGKDHIQYAEYIADKSIEILEKTFGDNYGNVY